jgi:Trk K+ transport system NAD-binding subunit
MINRNKTFLTPKGSTVLEAGDTLVVLSDTYSGIRSVYELLELDFKETTTSSS